MLNIYYGRESQEKERFLYDMVRREGYGPDQRVLILVPDQYTLEAERQAYRFLGEKALIGVEFYSLSRLGHNILKECGMGRTMFVDKYGRQMLLTKIISKTKDNLEVYGSAAGKSSFLELTNDFISQMKQFGITPEGLGEIAEKEAGQPLLQKKLQDLSLIYDGYQKAIEGKYTDAEDYIDLFLDKMGDSKIIAGTKIWVYGFDSFSPKSMEVLGGFLSYAEDVNVILTMDEMCRDEDLFLLTKKLKGGLCRMAEERNVPIGRISEIQGYDRQVSPALSYLEKELFSPLPRAYSGEPEGIHVVKAANIYSEAESAAAYIRGLLRDRGYRYRDIVVICNDQEDRAPAYQRVFREYGLNLFIDTKRSVLDSPLAVYVVSLLTVVGKRFRTVDVMRVLKSGMFPISQDDLEELENYVIKYRITGMMWKKPFEKGVYEYGAEALDRLNETRAQVAASLEELEALCQRKQTNEEFVKNFYEYLVESSHLQAQMKELVALQQQENLADMAEIGTQIWNVMISLFDQIVELIGEERFRIQEFTDMLTEGFRSVEVGILPASVDDLMLGTLQRSRHGEVKAMVIMGANDGILPQKPQEDGLFGFEELEQLSADGHEICKLDQVRMQEEKLAIYRNFCGAAEELWVSYSGSDLEGKEIRQSELVETLQDIFGPIQELDIVSRGESSLFIDGRNSTLRHLTEKMGQAVRKGEKADPIWKAVRDWYREKEKDAVLTPFAWIEEGLQYENRPPALSRSSAGLLLNQHGGRGVLSPSRLETYSRCPFRYFVQYGLAPKERRVYETQAREIGDVYHSCIMEITGRLTREGLWDSITEEACRAMVAEAVDHETKFYREGLFRSGKPEEYRADRLKKTCEETVLALVEQARAGRIRSSLYEVGFGNGKPIPGIEVPVLGGDTIYIEGKIDRLDTLENGRVKIIDYKSGNQEIEVEEVEQGYSLQLMLYLKAAEEGTKEPAGVFYFHIQNPRIKKNSSDEDIREAVRSSFRMQGFMVDEKETVEQVAGAMDAGESSMVLAVKKKKDGDFGKNKVLLSEEAFKELEQQLTDRVSELCQKLSLGDISISPTYYKDKSNCLYCNFRGICRFDQDYAGNAYRIISKG